MIERIFLFKFAASTRKEQFVIDSGFRCHLSQYARTTAGAPSPFVTRLRKFLRSRRVTRVSQVGTDRILEFEFSDGQYHLFLEFYAGGNVVLTDNAYKIIALQRNVNEGAPHERLRAGLEYDLSARQNIGGIPPMTKERLQHGLQSYIARQETGQQSTNKKLKKKAGDTLRKALAASINEYPPMLIDHSLRTVGFDINLTPKEVLGQEELLDKLLLSMRQAQQVMDEIMAKDVVKGYIFGKPITKSYDTKEDGQDSVGPGSQPSIMYEDFHPFKPKHIAEDGTVQTLEFEGFNHAVDDFFSSIEGQKLETRLAEKERHARQKLENAKQEQDKRIGGLQQVQENNVRKAQAIEANLERVKEAAGAVNGLIAQGMDWDEIEKLVELEQRRQNAVAQVIKLPLKLQENTITLRLAEWNEQDNDEEIDAGYESSDADPSASEGEDDNDDEGQGANKSEKPTTEVQSGDKRLNVDIDLSLSPWSNARDYYDQKRSAASKEEKTQKASAKALKSTQRKVETDLKRALKQEKQTLRPVRNAFWFEKFRFFLSSDGYLVLGATDSQQSDLLWRKYLKSNDVWVHADLDGALPCVVKNRSNIDGSPIPPGTLSQAGSLCVATSKAWDSKAVMSAWWVSAKQVSKRARTSDYLAPGRFEVSGNKSFLPPTPLLLGFAVLFQVSEQSKARHMKHRIQDEQPTASPEVHPAHSASDQDDNVGADSTVDADTNGHSEQPAEYEDDETVDDSASNGRSETDQQDEGEEANGDDEKDEENGTEVEAAAEGDGLNERSNPLQPNATAFDDADGEDDEDMAPVSQGGNEEDATASESEDVEQERKDEAEQKTVEAVRNEYITADAKIKAPIPVRGKKGKKKKVSQKYAEQDEEDRAEAMRLLGSAAGQQKQKEEAAAKDAREKEQAAQRQRRREQHQKAQERRAQKEQDGEEEEEEETTNSNVDLDTFVGTPLPGDEILEALPICAPWGALGRYKYKAKLQPGSEKKGKAVRSILGKWGADAAVKKNKDEKSEDTERIWPREMELIKSWKEAEIFGAVPVSKVRVMMSGASGKEAGKGGKQKSKKPSGRGSKKQR
ncbi:MAG: hypothetical protein Q9162_007459 [Coniocarpon cinnabarinum]